MIVYMQTYNLDLFYRIKITNVFFIWKWILFSTSNKCFSLKKISTYSFINIYYINFLIFSMLHVINISIIDTNFGF